MGAEASVYVRRHRLGSTYLAETGFLVSQAPDTVLAPDWAFVSSERVPAERPRGYVPAVPDVVLEVRSPGNAVREVALKVGKWLEAGVRIVSVLAPGAVLTGEDVIPGFELELSEVFE